MKKKTVALLLACVMALGVAVGGSLAWLTAKTDDVQNTFTPSDIAITLTENNPANKTAKMVPGHTIAKDPLVTVKDGSEDCYIFVKVVEKNNTIDGLAAVEGIENSAGKVLLYAVDSEWKSLEGVDNVYYQIVKGLTAEANESDWSDYVLKDKKVVINQNVTKEMMNGTLKTNQPTLSFISAAVQLYKTNVGDTDSEKQFTPTEAYNNLPKEFKDYPPATT